MGFNLLGLLHWVQYTISPKQSGLYEKQRPKLLHASNATKFQNFSRVENSNNTQYSTKVGEGNIQYK